MDLRRKYTEEEVKSFNKVESTTEEEKTHGYQSKPPNLNHRFRVWTDNMCNQGMMGSHGYSSVSVNDNVFVYPVAFYLIPLAPEWQAKN